MAVLSSVPCCGFNCWSILVVGLNIARLFKSDTEWRVSLLRDIACLRPRDARLQEIQVQIIVIYQRFQSCNELLPPACSGRVWPRPACIVVRGRHAAFGPRKNDVYLLIMNDWMVQCMPCSFKDTMFKKGPRESNNPVQREHLHCLNKHPSLFTIGITGILLSLPLAFPVE